MAHRDAAHENEITPIHVHFRRMVRPLCTCAETYFSGPYVHYKRDTIPNSESPLASLVSTQSFDKVFPRLSLPVHSGSLKRIDYLKQLSGPSSFF